VTFWNEIVVFSDPDRFWRVFIPPNVANLVRFARGGVFACFLGGLAARLRLAKPFPNPLKSGRKISYA
jgi:hypothetical protein